MLCEQGEQGEQGEQKSFGTVDASSRLSTWWGLLLLFINSLLLLVELIVAFHFYFTKCCFTHDLDFNVLIIIVQNIHCRQIVFGLLIIRI